MTVYEIIAIAFFVGYAAGVFTTLALLGKDEEEDK